MKTSELRAIVARLGTDHDDRTSIGLFAEVIRLREALAWYVAEDDVLEGDKWDDINAHWIAGRNRARALLAEHDE